MGAGGGTVRMQVRSGAADALGLGRNGPTNCRLHIASPHSAAKSRSHARSRLDSARASRQFRGMFNSSRSRRSAIRSTALAALGLLALGSASFAAPKPKILFFSKSSGFEHSVISYKTGQPSLAEKALAELGEQNGWEFTFSKDGSLFSSD